MMEREQFEQALDRYAVATIREANAMLANSEARRRIAQEARQALVVLYDAALKEIDRLWEATPEGMRQRLERGLDSGSGDTDNRLPAPVGEAPR
jgi:hypothetical protein